MIPYSHQRPPLIVILSDTFTGCYAADYVRQKAQGDGHWDIKKAVQRACRASAHTISKAGAQAAIPWANEIEDIEPEE